LTTMENKLGPQVLNSKMIACPNARCRELFVTVSLHNANVGAGGHTLGRAHSSWVLRPMASVKPFPEYVPEGIRADYAEARLIVDLSPKASATLSRRCLQGMTRDFWGVKEKDLFHEIKALQTKVDANTWQALDAVRTIGNIGAHMENDINLIVDVEPHEALLLVELIERLIEDWYVQRHEHNARMSEIVSAASRKKAAKKSPPNTTPPADTSKPPPGEPAPD